MGPDNAAVGSPSTSWELIEQAVAGDAAARERFARLYRPAVERFFQSRWRGVGLTQEVEDAVQEVLVECLREGGALEGALATAREGLRAFLFGVCRNVAQRWERRIARQRDRPRSESFAADAVPLDDPSVSREFDRAWARTLVHEAREVLEKRAVEPHQQRRLDLLRLRFFEGLPIREIAARWNEDAARVHRDYAAARDDFRTALGEVLAFHSPGPLHRRETELVALLHDLN